MRGIACLIAFACVAALACKTKGTTVVGSCNQPKKANDPSSSHTCADFRDKKLLKSLCATWNGQLSDAPCDRTGAVGACHDDDDDTWYYADSYQDPQGLSKICGGKPVILASGGDFKPKTDSEVNAGKVRANIAQSGAAARANLATVATVAKKLPAPTNKVDLQGLHGDVLLVHAEDLADLEHPKKLGYRLAGSTDAGDCSRILGGRAKSTEDGLVLSQCAAPPVLAVVSVTAFKEPASAGQTTEGKTRTTFVTRGRVAGDVLLFRLSNASYLGSFSFDAQNGPIDPSSTMDRLETELFKNYVASLDARAHASAPPLTIHFAVAR